MMIYPITWRDFLGRLDDVQYPLEIVQHPACNAASTISHVCAARDKNLSTVAFASILVADVRDILNGIA